MILRTDLRRDSPAESLIVSSVNAISSVRNPPDHKKRLERFEMKEIPYEKQLTTSSESSLASSADDSSGAATVSAPTESGSSALSYSCSCSRTSSSALQLQQCPVSTDDNDSLSISSIDSLHDALEVEFHTDLDNEMHYSSLKVPPPSSPPPSEREFMALRFTYLLVTLVIMLADGLQGTHLYVLYESYGFSVASLYCLGFATGGVMSPITGPLVDKIGRKKSAILYCALEIFINMLEQYPFLYGLIVSRMIGGFTTNLLSSVFETWLDTEYRRRGFQKEKYEIIMRDSVIVSNSAAIFSGYLAHILAERYGNVGPFEGAVTCTSIALIVVCFVWTENYGSSVDDCTKDMLGYFREAVSAFRNDNKMLRVGVLQGFTAGSIQIFVFLWAPTLRQFSKFAPAGTWGLDHEGEPAFGLIFSAFMGAGVLGGLIAPRLRKLVSTVISPIVDDDAPIATVEIEGEGEVIVRPMAVEFLASACYIVSALMLFVPCLCSEGSSMSFSFSLMSLLLFELMIGIFLPCEGVIRSLYFPANARASIMTLPRIVVNFSVALGVVSTNFVSLKTAFFAVACLMVISSALQLSLISEREWSSLFSRFDRAQGKMAQQTRRLSFSVRDMLCRMPSVPKNLGRRLSATSMLSGDEICDDGQESDSRLLQPEPKMKKEKVL